MSSRNDLKMLVEAYGGVEGVPLTPTNMLGGKPVMITMDMPGAEIDHEGHESHEHEEHSGEIDQSEIEMACVELHKISEYAPKLQEMVKEMGGLEGWIASKITKASDYISSVYHYLEYKHHEGGEIGSGCEEENMYDAGHEDIEACPYAKQGCTCGGCSECHK